MEALNSELIKNGLSPREAAKLSAELSNSLKKLSPEQCWKLLSQDLLPHYPFAVHLLLYKTIYPDWDNLPAPAWLPDEKQIKASNLGKWMAEKGYRDFSADYPVFHRWSVKNYPDFWQKMVSLLNIQFDQSYSKVVDLSAGLESPKWFPGAKINISNSCFQAKKKTPAIIYQTEQGKTTTVSYDDLDKLSNRIANSLSRYLKKGDRAAIIMPMTPEAVALFLGIIKMGCVVVAIPDSFSAEEMAIRLKISATKAVFCQDLIVRAGKILPLYDRILKAEPPLTIVLPFEKKAGLNLRNNDLEWSHFLAEDSIFTPVTCDPQEHINILFSSGTTGEPKAIPWTHTSPIKCASDAYLHHDLKANDIFCWPSNLGWMMGPWLIFACLLNKATLALYNGTPNGKAFGKFIHSSKITHLGVVPTLVRNWRNTACMEGLNWKTIKLFTSTGERSNVDDMLYLMSLAHYKPIIEYCGGTEIAGAYITGTVIQPSAPAAFSTQALGLDFVLLDENGDVTDKGEVALLPPSIGLSTELLNKAHHPIYYAKMPKSPDGNILRRHGDQIKRCANGYYRLLGRSDDTMKLGGIKISSAEIENILNTLDGIEETAAIAVDPLDASPTQLIIYAVLKATYKAEATTLKEELQKRINQYLNPLFKIHEVIIVPTLPRTASNKIMRRVLREGYLTQRNMT